MSDLILHLKDRYFEEIKAGTKTEEYRLPKDYWRKRLEGKTFERVVVIKRYPSKLEMSSENVMYFPWNGVEKKIINHPEFGDRLVEVYAIALKKES
jgi:ASC-1-like (ASCH) protein